MSMLIINNSFQGFLKCVLCVYREILDSVRIYHLYHKQIKQIITSECTFNSFFLSIQINHLTLKFNRWFPFLLRCISKMMFTLFAKQSIYLTVTYSSKILAGIYNYNMVKLRIKVYKCKYDLKNIKIELDRY